MQHPEISRTSMSTSAVVKKIVLPATEKAPARGGCFADAVERAADGSGSGGSGGGGGVVSRGRAFFQVSHAWSAPLSATLLALQEHFSPARQALWRPGHKPIPMTEVCLHTHACVCLRAHACVRARACICACVCVGACVLAHACVRMRVSACMRQPQPQPGPQPQRPLHTRPQSWPRLQHMRLY
eukprot:365728-Chlamydomonas_euryale.AAC.13